MSARTLDGKWVRDQIFLALKPRIASCKRPPGLAVVLIGNDPPSEIYVRNKVKACADLGIYSEKITPPADLSTPDLLAIIRALNARDEIDAILVQSPMPPQIDHRTVLSAISPAKDADGFHPVNIGNLVAN